MKANDRPCEPDCRGFADYAAVPCPNPACDDRVKAAWEQAQQSVRRVKVDDLRRPRRPQYGECPYCGVSEDDLCLMDCPALDAMDYR